MGVQSSNYFPKCRKDAQCKCSMCVDSLNATRDLRPPSSSSTSSASRMFRPITNALGLGFGSPIPSFMRSGKDRWSMFESSPVTPYNSNTSSKSPLSEMKPHAVMLEPVFEEIASCNSSGRRSKLFRFWWIWLAMVLLLSAEFVTPLLVSKLFKTELSPAAVKKMVEESRARVKTADRLDLLQRRIQRVVGGDFVVSTCTGRASKWTLAEEGSFIHSYCSLHSSAAEHVSLWGYPIATAGVLGRKPMNRYMTVLSGRIFEWKEGQPDYIIHKEGESWTHDRWSASAIHLDKDTWIIEYSASSADKPWGGVSAAAYALKSFTRSLLLNVKWTLDCFTFASYSIRIDSPIPT